MAAAVSNCQGHWRLVAARATRVPACTSIVSSAPGAVLSRAVPSLPRSWGCSRGSRRTCGNLPFPAHFHPAPKAWGSCVESGSVDRAEYGAADIETWRADFGFARRQHSLAEFGYTDDELCEWRKLFDKFACESGIVYDAFETFVTRKYRGVLPDDQVIAELHNFWQRIDKDGDNYIDFGQFILASFLVDVTFTKEMIRQKCVEDVFRKYAVGELMAEPHMFELMCDFRFFVATATDVHKLMQVADQDRDGLVSLSDFTQWAASEDDGLEDLNEARKGRRRKTVRQSVPPVPQDDE